MSQEWFDIPKSWLAAEHSGRRTDERINATKADKARLAVSQIIRTCGGNQNTVEIVIMHSLI
jgi:hypothetical protein